jgi:hypothetical protein
MVLDDHTDLFSHCNSHASLHRTSKSAVKTTCFPSSTSAWPQVSFLIVSRNFPASNIDADVNRLFIKLF